MFLPVAYIAPALSFFLFFFFYFHATWLPHVCGVATISHLLAQVDLQGERERETWKVPCWKPCHESAHCTTVVAKYGLFRTQEFHGNFTEVYVFL